MDDHMLDRIENDIDLCFMLVNDEEKRALKDGCEFKIKEDLNYKAASVLIGAYNKLVKMYYLPQYVRGYFMPRTDIAYKNYKKLH